MKKMYTFAAMAAMFLCACGGQKAVTNSNPQEVEVIQPCYGIEYQTTDEFLRASAMGISNNQEIANQKAMVAARTKLAAAINTTVKSVVDDYAKSIGDNNIDDTKQRYESLSRQIIDQSLSGVRVICQKLMKDTANNTYKAYVAIELGGSDMINKLQTVSANTELKLDYDYEKFKKTFEEEMNKLK